jgi:hypothetical protein
VFCSDKIHVAHDQSGPQLDMWCNDSTGPGSEGNRLTGDRAATLLRRNGSRSSPSISLPTRSSTASVLCSGGYITSCMDVDQSKGPVEWPLRSPDLTPLDAFLWRHLSPRCTITDRDELRTPVQYPCRDAQPLHNKQLIRCVTVVYSVRQIFNNV